MKVHAAEAINKNPNLIKQYQNAAPAPANASKAAVATDNQKKAEAAAAAKKQQDLKNKQEENSGFQISVSKLEFAPEVENKTKKAQVQPVAKAQAPPPKIAPVVVKTQKLVKKEKESTGFVIESTKLEPEVEIKGTPKIITQQPAPPRPVVDQKTKKLQQKLKVEPQTFTIETIKMESHEPDLNTTVPAAPVHAEVKPDLKSLAHTTKMQQKKKEQQADFKIVATTLELPEEAKHQKTIDASSIAQTKKIEPAKNATATVQFKKPTLKKETTEFTIESSTLEVPKQVEQNSATVVQKVEPAKNVTAKATFKKPTLVKKE